VNCGKASTSTTLSSKITASSCQLVKLGMGFFSFETAWRTVQGYEAMNMRRSGQIHGVEKGDNMKQVTFIASLFGVVV